jgi:hypothetical protein
MIIQSLYLEYLTPHQDEQSQERNLLEGIYSKADNCHCKEAKKKKKRTKLLCLLVKSNVLKQQSWTSLYRLEITLSGSSSSMARAEIINITHASLLQWNCSASWRDAHDATWRCAHYLHIKIVYPIKNNEFHGLKWKNVCFNGSFNKLKQNLHEFRRTNSLSFSEMSCLKGESWDREWGYHYVACIIRYGADEGFGLQCQYEMGDTETLAFGWVWAGTESPLGFL